MADPLLHVAIELGPTEPASLGGITCHLEASVCCGGPPVQVSWPEALWMANGLRMVPVHSILSLKRWGCFERRIASE